MWHAIRFTHTLEGYTYVRMQTLSYSVPGMHCGHCKEAVEREVSAVAGVESADADLESKLVTVKGASVSDEAVRAAIEEAGYDVA
jgi:copper chaperone